MDKRLRIYKLIVLALLIVGIGMIAGGVYGLSYVERIDKEFVSTTAKIESIKQHTELRHGKRRTHRDVVVSLRGSWEDLYRKSGSVV